jgi:tRNA pseudouridine synthase 10
MAALETFVVDDAVLASARQAAPLGLCPECYGRIFGRHGHGLTNPQRAERLEAALAEPRARLDPCPLCRGAFDRWEVWLDRAVEAAKALDFERFSCGSRWDPEILAREESIWTEIGAPDGESARNAFNREWGKRLQTRTGAKAEPGDPEIVLLADLPMGRIEITVRPIYFEGRYRKLDRTIPQTRWPCRRCQGRGCEQCQGSGKTYAESVEELVAAPFLAATLGENTRFHGMGREDIDARMLGDGRPFVLEILRPKHRRVDAAALGAEVAVRSNGRVEVLGMRPADAAAVLRVKEASPEKSYRVVVVGAVPLEKVKEALSVVPDRAIAQRTPTRVVHRRSDLVRTRRIRSVRLVEAAEGRFTLDLRAEAGTYIKEWVEGDGGRTEPSLAQLLDAPLKVDSLDVLDIHDREV